MAKRAPTYIRKDFTLRVGRSATGKGLFAEESIPKGAYVIEYIGRPATEYEKKHDAGKYLFWTSDTEMINGNIPANRARYINHSCVPNCEAVGPKGRIFIRALRNIKPGEELSYDYGDEHFDKYIKPRGCKCRRCAPKTVSRNV